MADEPRPMRVEQEFRYTSTVDGSTKTAVPGEVVDDVHPRHYDWATEDGPLLSEV